MTEKRILTSWKEISEFIGVHPETAQKLAVEWGLPHVKIGGSIMTTVNLLELWVTEKIEQRQEVEAEKEP